MNSFASGFHFSVLVGEDVAGSTMLAVQQSFRWRVGVLARSRQRVLTRWEKRSFVGDEMGFRGGSPR